MGEDDENDYGADDCRPSQLRPAWNRRERREHEIDIFLAGIAGLVLGIMLVVGLIHR
jgi:hypothetical protein